MVSPLDRWISPCNLVFIYVFAILNLTFDPRLAILVQGQAIRWGLVASNLDYCTQFPISYPFGPAGKNKVSLNIHGP